MIATKEKTIDGIRYSVTQFPARKGLRLKHRLGRTIAPALGPMLASAKGADLSRLLDADIDLTQIGIGIAAAIQASEADDCVDLILALLQDTRRQGSEITEASFDIDFAADYGHMYRVLGFVIQVNYSNLLAVVESAGTIKASGSAGAIANLKSAQ